MDPRPSLPDWHLVPGDSFSPDRATVQRWLDAYVAAWKSYDEAEIADLWAEDAVWIYPFGVRATGRGAITAEWMREKHVFTGRGYDARFEPIAIDGGIVVTVAPCSSMRRRALRRPSTTMSGCCGLPGTVAVPNSTSGTQAARSTTQREPDHRRDCGGRGHAVR
jgi:hypothetical protein